MLISLLFTHSSCSTPESDHVSVEAQLSGLELTLSANKKIFKTGETINLFICFKNISGQDLYLIKPQLMDFIGLESHNPYPEKHNFNSRVYVESYRSDYQIEILKKLKAVPHFPREIMTISKGGTYTFEVICSEKFNTDIDKELYSIDNKTIKHRKHTQAIPTYICSIPCKTNLSVCYKADKNNSHGLFVDTWEGEIKTPPLEIEIIDYKAASDSESILRNRVLN